MKVAFDTRSGHGFSHAEKTSSGGRLQPLRLIFPADSQCKTHTLFLSA